MKIHHTISHIHREANSVVDAFSKLGLQKDLEFYVFNAPPSCTSALCTADLVGVSYPRLCIL